MINKLKKVLFATAFAMAFIVTPIIMSTENVKVEAATTKTEVKYKLKKGVLKIYGKGEMPENMSFAKNQKIKKVVIKKGVTSINEHAFDGCENLEKVTIAKTVEKIGAYAFCNTALKEITFPASVKKIGIYAIVDNISLKTVNIPGEFELFGSRKRDHHVEIVSGPVIENVNFNTNLNPEILYLLEGENWNVNENDPNYSSIDGAIYTKDGKRTVAVPRGKKEFIVAKECEIFDFHAIEYRYKYRYISELDCFHFESYCEKLEKVVISENVRRIEAPKEMGAIEYYNLESIELKSTNLDEESIEIFINNLRRYSGHDYLNSSLFDSSYIYSFFPGKIKYENQMYILNDKIIIKYNGDAEGLIIPEGIEKIAEFAFMDNNTLEEILIPSTVKEIQEYAFYNCRNLKNVKLQEGLIGIKTDAFGDCAQLENIDLPNTLTEIGERAFYNTSMKKVTVSDSVTSIGDYAFANSDIEEAILPKHLRVIPNGLFCSCNKLTKVSVPENVEVIGSNAFYETKVSVQEFLDVESLRTIESCAFYGVYWRDLTLPSYIATVEKGTFWQEDNIIKRNVTIECNPKRVDVDAFGVIENRQSRITIEYKCKPKKYKVGVDLMNITKGKAYLAWRKVSGVDGYDIRVRRSKATDNKKEKRVLVGKNKTSKTIKISKKWKDVDVRIRPYTIVKGKKVYGKWTVIDR